MSNKRRQRKAKHSTRKRKTKARLTGVRQFAWTTSQTSFVLAWLDHRLEQGNGTTYFENTAAEQLQKRWEIHPDLRDVTNLVRRVFQKYKDHDNPATISRGAIWRLGTSCLRFGDNPEALKLREALKAAKSDLRADSERQNLPRRTRTPRSTSAVAPSTQSRRLRSHDSSCTVADSNERSAGFTELGFSKRFDCKAGTPLLDQIAIRSTDEDAGDTDNGHISNSTVTRSEYHRTQKIPETPKESEARNLVGRNEDLSARASIVDRLKLKVAQLATENIELRTELYALRNATNDQDYVRHSGVKDMNNGDPKSLDKMRKRERELTLMLDKSRKLNMVVTNKSFEGLAPSLADIRDSFDFIFWRLEGLCLQHNDLFVRAPRAFIATPSSKDLLGKVFRETPKGVDRNSGSWRWPRSESVHYVARAITGAAIQRWVFESSWPDCNERNSRLLYFTRKCVAMGQGGMNALHSVDSLAHYFLFEEETNTVLSKAGELAQALIDIMKETFSHWLRRGETRDVWNLLEKEESTVKDLMNTALTLKQHMLFSEKLHYLFEVPPGTQFDERTMSVEMIQEDLLSQSKEVPMTVKFCLSPGLAFRRSRLQSLQEATENPLDWTQALVRYTMSKSLEPITEIGIKEEIVSKARVLLSSNH